MNRSFTEFARRMAQYDVNLFYYAGHGMEVDGERYLIPVDALPDNKIGLDTEAFKLNLIDKYFNQLEGKLNIMILDACRNNPYRSWTRGSAGGFSAVNQQPEGSIIAYATQAGQTASDGMEGNGLYTKNLVEQMYKPLSISEVFMETRKAVREESNGRQTPMEWSSLLENFYFTPPTSDFDGNTVDPAVPMVAKNTELISTESEGTRFGTKMENFEAGPANFVDDRDKRLYETMGLQVVGPNRETVPMVWMAENLKYPLEGSYKVDGTKELLYTWKAAVRRTEKTN